MSKHARIVVPTLLGALALAASAWASAPPVGPLPPGPTKHFVLKPGATAALSLPKLADPGLVWRIARPYDASSPSAERRGDAVHGLAPLQGCSRRQTSIRSGLTRGETRTALLSETFRIDVR